MLVGNSVVMSELYFKIECEISAAASTARLAAAAGACLETQRSSADDKSVIACEGKLLAWV